MGYSITLIQSAHEDQNGLRLIRIQVTVNRVKVYAPTIAKVRTDQFVNGRVVNHPKQTKLNSAINAQITGIEDRLLDELRKSSSIVKERLDKIVKNDGQAGPTKLVVYSDGLQESLAGKVSPGRLRHYKVITAKINEFAPEVTLSEISTPWLNKFEAHIRKKGISSNTVVSNMSILLAILAKAAADELISRDQYAGYKRTKYKDPFPVYLTETEISKVHDLAEKLGPGNLKLSAFYFLLSCYTGYRISDAKAFNYEDRVENGAITLRATKNGKIVSIPIHTRLEAVLEYIKDKPINITEEHIRKYVKEICRLAGIKKEVKFHSSRHSFGMLLRVNKFSTEEIAYLLGDSEKVAKIYASMHNPTISAKVLDALG